MLDSPDVRNSVRILVYTDTFTSQDSLVQAEAARGNRDEAAVGRDFIADSDSDDITWNKLRCMYARNLTGAKHRSLIWRIFFESLDKKELDELESIKCLSRTHVNGLLCICLLDDTDCSIRYENEKNDQGLYKCGPPVRTLFWLFKQS